MIRRLLLLLLPLLLHGAVEAGAQSYASGIDSFRQAYKLEFVTESNSPLKKADTGYLRFYRPDSAFAVIARFTATPDSKPFGIATHSGRSKPYRKYGTASFEINGKTFQLAIYQGLDLIKKPGLADHLFIPFNDLTNYETTYAGGRYLDLRTGDIRDGRINIDFNKAYNPYCAYAEGYACPIPPDENKLQVRIEAGEQLFARPGEE